MKKFIFIFSHKPTELQIEDAKNRFNVKEIIIIPDKLVKEIWSKIPSDLDSVEHYIEPVKKWLKSISQKDDIVLIQGDFGATYMMIQFCFKNGLIPVYSTTERTVIEKYDENGKVNLVHTFKHKIYRFYQRYKE